MRAIVSVTLTLAACLAVLASARADTLDLNAARDYYIAIQHQVFTTRETINPRMNVPEQDMLQPVDKIPTALTGYWIGFTLLNRTNSDEWMLDVRNVLIEDMVVHSQNATSHHISEKGFHKTWPFDLRYGAEIMLPKDQVTQVWVHISSRYGAAEPIVSVMPRSQYQQRSSSYSMQLLITIGALIILALYQIVLFIPTRDSAYFWSATANLAAALAWAAQCKALVYGLGIGASAATLYFPLFMAAAAGLQFTRSFLRIAYPQALAFMLDGASIIVLLTGILCLFLVPDWLYPALLARFLFLAVVIMVATACWRLYQGFSAIRFFLLGSTILLVSSIIQILNQGLHLDFLENGILAGTRVQLLAMFAFMLALIDRVNLQQRDRPLKDPRNVTDGVTGLPNRSAFERDVRAWEAYCKEGILKDFYLTFFDIVSLREVNHLKGQREGDRMLNLVGKWLCQQTDNRNVYRIGGDEFVVLSQKNIRWDIKILQRFLKQEGFKDIDIHLGTSCFSESACRSSLLKIADDRLHHQAVEPRPPTS